MEPEQEIASVTPPSQANQIDTAPPVEFSSSGTEAALGQRIGAALIDTLVAMGLAIVIGFINYRLGYIAYLGYILTRDSLPFLGGQSIGKKALNIQAVSESGKSLSGDWNTGLLRNLPMLIAIVELLILIVNKDKPGGLRRLGDQWAKTKVVNVTA